MAQYRTNKGRKQGVFRPTSAEKTQGNIFSLQQRQNGLIRATEAIKEVPCERRKTNIPNSVDATEIPEYVFESLARSLLPVIQKYYESEGGKKAFAEWKAKKEISDSAST